jgi:hypothetical protein
MVEDVKLPELFGRISVNKFKSVLMSDISQDKEAFNFVLPGTTYVLGPWFALKLEELISKFKKEESAPLLPASPIPADVVTLPEVNKSAPLSEPKKAKSAPPPKKGTKGAPGKPVAVPHPPPPLPSSQWVLASKDAPPVSVAKCMWCK